MLTGDIGTVYRDGLKRLSRHADAIIPIEKIKAPVLLVCGESDKLWPSCPMSRQLKARAESKGGPPVQLLAYPNAGHLCPFPPIPPSDPFFRRFITKASVALGGTIEGNNAARADGWPKIVAFVRAALGST